MGLLITYKNEVYDSYDAALRQTIIDNYIERLDERLSQFKADLKNEGAEMTVYISSELSVRLVFDGASDELQEEIRKSLTQS